MRKIVLIMPEFPEFGDRLAGVFRRYGQLCVGIDPHPEILGVWGLRDSAEGLLDFGMRTIEACVGQVGIVKPQVAFFERLGSAGLDALAKVIQVARQAKLLVISDAKRGDIGSTMRAYAEAWLVQGCQFESDAITVSPFLGFETLDAVEPIAAENKKGIFVLARTSNPGSGFLQNAKVNSTEGSFSGSVSSAILNEVNRKNQSRSGALGSFGVVIGATADLAESGIDLALKAKGVETPILAPGFGHQGATLASIRSIYGPAASSVIATVSRSVLNGDPKQLAARIKKNASELTEALS